MSRRHPRNVLLIICDDLNTTCERYGPEPPRTPNLDRLAGRGVRFDRAYCQSPLCTPSRASMLSGWGPDRTGIHDLKGNQFEIRPDTVTLPRLFRDRGYFTARSGKVFHKGVPDTICTRGIGADDPTAWDERSEPPCYELNTTGELHVPVPFRVYPAGAGGAINWLRAGNAKDEQHHDWRVAEDVVRWMRDRADRPWFLAAGLVRPHVPMVAPERFFRMYDDWPIRLPDRSAAATRDRPAHYKKWFGADVPIAEPDHVEAIKAYMACVSFVDEQVGRMLDALSATGQLENTLIVFTADHGYHLGEHGLWFKRSLYEESARVPLIIADPSRPEGHGAVHEEPVELLDVYPTVADAMGVEPSVKLDGQSLAPVLAEPSRRTGRCAFVQTGSVPGRGGVEGRSVRDRNWAYHAWRGSETAEELYDLRNDALQMRNLASEPEFTEQKQRLADLLQKALPWPNSP